MVHAEHLLAAQTARIGVAEAIKYPSLTLTADVGASFASITAGFFNLGADLFGYRMANADFELLDKEVDRIIWTFANLFPGCLIKSIDGIRQKKKYFWDIAKNGNRHWLAANMSGEAFLGFGAFNTKKITGQDTIDFIKFRQNVADSRLWDEQMFAEVMGKPKE